MKKHIFIALAIISCASFQLYSKMTLEEKFYHDKNAEKLLQTLKIQNIYGKSPIHDISYSQIANTILQQKKAAVLLGYKHNIYDICINQLQTFINNIKGKLNPQQKMTIKNEIKNILDLSYTRLKYEIEEEDSLEEDWEMV